MATEFLDASGLSHFKTKLDDSYDAKFLKKADSPTKTSQLTNDSGFQTAEQVTETINNKVTNVYRFKGTVSSYSDLPTTNNVIGDVYDVGGGMNYAWNGASWDALGDAKLTVDSALSDSSTNPVQNKVVKAALDAKMDANHVFPNATTTTSGHMSADDKKKLDGIETGANNYSLPTASASVLGGIKVGANLTITNGVLAGTPDTTYDAITNAEIDALFA